MVRIIAGTAKGRRLKVPKKTSLIHPLLSRIRQSLFDTIRPKLTASNFLDLYAGTGIVGLEAISRGAQFVVFIDKGREGIHLIRQNVAKLGYESKSLILQGDVLGGALLILQNHVSSFDGFFDLVFVAPPYLGKDRRGDVLVMTQPTLERLAETKLLAPGAWVVCQHHKKEPIKIPDSFQVYKEAVFGESVLTYLRGRS